MKKSYLKKHDVELATCCVIFYKFFCEELYHLYSVIHSFLKLSIFILILDDLQFIVVGQKLTNCRPLENALKVSEGCRCYDL